MATANDSVFKDKRDLHIGGIGNEAASGSGDRGSADGGSGAGGSGAFPPGGFVEHPAYDEDAASVTAGLTAAAEALIEGAERWAARARDAARNADGYVRTSPWQAVGVAAIVGIAAGYFASRRNLPWRS
jgi:hypothetical protein